ncbi:MAG TPA: PIN domain-containing protein [Conexibacter sp.]|nr:PIN domain-containing protein [Conexibacter sp.]
MRAILDTSVLIADDAPTGLDVAISAVSLGELQFGLLLADDDAERARRALRLATIESSFSPLSVDAAVAREWGVLAALVARRDAQPRRRQADLLIAATARVHDALLLTHNVADFTHVADEVRVARPQDAAGS